MVAPHPDEMTTPAGRELKLTDAVTQKYRQGIMQRLKNTYDFGAGNIAPAVVLEVMAEELEKLKTFKLDTMQSEKSKVYRTVSGDPAEEDETEDAGF